MEEFDSYSITIEELDLSMNDFFSDKLDLFLKNISSDKITRSVDDDVVSNNIEMGLLSNTPLNISQNNSDSESELIEDSSPREDYEIHNEMAELNSKTSDDVIGGGKHYRELTFDEVEKSIEKYYDYETKYSNEFDLLITYLNGQKHLFIQSQKITETKLNMLIVPSLVMSATITLFLPLSNEKNFWWTSIFVSILNAVITLLISLVNYYKLESSQQLFGYFANQYDKLLTDLEFKNNRLLFMDKKLQKPFIIDTIQIFEKKMNEIKESYIILVPEELNRLFPIIYHINIFAVIKRIENYKMDLICKFRDVKNEIRFILFKWQKNGVKTEKEKKRLTLLIETKEKIRKQLISYKNSYHDIDILFNREIKFAESYRNFFLLSSCCITKKIQIIPNDCNDISVDILQLTNY
jgi:hypothetical protein